MKFTDDPLTICPECNEEDLHKVFQPVGIVFKGSGFYVTDNRSSSKGASRLTSSSESSDAKKEGSEKSSESSKKESSSDSSSSSSDSTSSSSSSSSSSSDSSTSKSDSSKN
jgi:predicted nucleic acid-binding Zn ribbon protein